MILIYINHVIMNTLCANKTKTLPKARFLVIYLTVNEEVKLRASRLASGSDGIG
jgi:hypothetical protein